MSLPSLLAPLLALIATALIAIADHRQNKIANRISHFLVYRNHDNLVGKLSGKLVHRLPNRDAIEAKLTLTAAKVSVRQFRIQQFLSGIVGLGFGLFLNLITIAKPSLIIQALLPTSVLVGWHLPMANLNSRFNRLRDNLNFGFGEAVDLIALAVTAGNSLTAAIIQVADAVSSPWREQLINIRQDLSSGLSIFTSLDRAKTRLNLPAFTKFVNSALITLERGTPLSAQLRIQANEVAEMLRRDLMQKAGKKETAMLLPIVFLILPTIVIATLFPGVLALGKLI